MSRPVTLGQPAAGELHAGRIRTASVDGTTTYTLDAQPDRVRGPARYLRAAAPTATGGDPAHTHDRPAPPAEGTPCLVVTIGGSLTNAWVIPFE